ncbi:hypothetical protein P3T76_002696 [Phytophthora citrophthora]|uniref:RxLR effector protein n=1 Tax=Phytophthora citrophthora TaxID=4793 RepID=A0AAD9GX40_9STRA|nr:hypothetical protein P3T76_002696 [Phytophthora citrophthora]
MRACHILLLAVAILLENTFESASAATALKPANAAHFPSLEANYVESVRDTRKRALRSLKAENEEEQSVNDSEERIIPGTSKIITGLKNWADVEKRLERQLMKGESNFAKMYKKKKDPYNLFTTFKFGNLSDAEKAESALYQMWAKYFKFWVDRNAGKVQGKR